MPADQMARYEFRRKMEELKEMRGRATELISLYVPPGRQIADVSNYLRNEYAQSSNIKSRTTRKNVMSAIETILNRIKLLRKPPENGIVYFCGHKAVGHDKTEMVLYIIEPPEPINTYLYRCDSEFHLQPLEDFLEEKEWYGLVVMDRSECALGILKGKRIEALEVFESLVPSKHGRGGQSQRRFERLIEIAAHEFFTKVGEKVNQAFVGNPRIKGILIGGPGSTKDVLAKKDYLHHELRKIVLDTFDTGYTDETGLKELVEKARQRLHDLDLNREKNLVTRFMREAVKPDSGLSLYGRREVEEAVSAGAVETLILSEGLRERRISTRCPSCGNGETVIRARTPNPEAEAPLLCTKCSSPADVDEERDVVAEFVRLASENGTKVELVSTDTEEGNMLLKGFGGVAAILRYKARA